jgi:DNA polymerase-3 subunit alpha/error-prone DNA polymerase
MRLLTTGPDVNISQWRYSGNSNDQKMYRGTVVIGFMAIKGLSSEGATAILEERKKGGNFTSLEDFSGRVKIGRDDIIALCPAGVFDSIADGLPRPLQARSLLSAGCAHGQEELFASPVFKKPSHQIQIKKDDITPREEYDALGFLRSVHPLALWKDDVTAVKDRVKAAHIAQFIGRNIKMIGWPVTQKDVWTKDGLTMSFLSLEDETDIYETVVFPQVYERYSKLLFDQKPLLVFGRVVNDLGAIAVEIERLEILGD